MSIQMNTHRQKKSVDEIEQVYSQIVAYSMMYEKMPTQGEICKQLSISGPKMTRYFERLVARGKLEKLKGRKWAVV